MTSGIELYINGVRADIEEDALILMNYSSDDLQDPTIVKNSYSQSVTLPGTTQNEKIFGMFFRSIRTSRGLGTGAQFSPLKKLPFSIYAKTGELMEMGYCKLEDVAYEGGNHSYKVTLFGGIGDFLYGLMYREDGEKKNLADLRYLGGGDDELNFTISASTIRTAWETLKGANILPYNIINFAPCNNGLPEDFDANKAFVMYPTAMGFPESATDGEGTEVEPRMGAIVEFEQDFSEWEMRELRSYLQRPVISLKAILSAICDETNNGGYIVNLDESFFNDGNPYYTKTWMTLPMLTEIDITTSSEEDGTTSNDLLDMVDTSRTKSFEVWSNTGNPGTMQGIMNVEIYGTNRTVAYADALVLGHPGTNAPRRIEQSPLAFAFIGYDSSDNAVIASSLYILESEKASDKNNYYSISDQDIENTYFSEYSNLISSTTRLQGDFVADINSDTFQHKWNKKIEVGFTNWYNVTRIEMVIGGDVRTSVLYKNPLGVSVPNEKNFVDAFGISVDYTMDRVVERVTNGVTFSKGDLLADTMSPADFLLSFIKTFNLKIFCDNKDKVIDIVTDENYLNGEYLDLDGRVDEQSKKVLPLACDTSRLLFSSEQVESAAAEQYKLRYRKQFGDFLVYTGYEFNDEQKDLMESVQFRSAVAATNKGDYFQLEQREGATSVLPAAAFTPASAKYYDGYREATAERGELPLLVSIPYNSVEGYDSYGLAQFCDNERKGVDGSGVILFFSGMMSPSVRYVLTDDYSGALTLNDNKPCWQIERNVTYLYFPFFSRHIGGANVNTLWDWGLPKEFFDIDVRGYSEDAGIYNKYWRNFIAEQYSAETRQLEVKVDLEGVVVGQEILRRPVFYDGCWWYISKISNHALAKGELTEMTLVKMVNFQYNELIEE